MRNPEYYGSVEKTRDRATDVLDKSGLAYFVALCERDSKSPFVFAHGKIGETHYSYELAIKAAVSALSHYDKKGQVKWLKIIGKKLGYEIEVKQ